MKNFVGLSFFLLFFGVAHAEGQLKIEKGELMIVFLEWLPTGVRVTPEAQKYPEAVEQVFRDPGKVVVVEKKTSHVMVDWFHYREDTTAKLSVRYDAHAPEAVIFVSERDDEILETKIRFSPYLLFWLVSVGAFFVSGRTREGTKAIFAITVFAATICAAFAAFTAAVFASAASTILAFAVAVFAAIAAATTVDDRVAKLYKIYSSVFYGLMILSAGLMYYPLLLG